MAKELEFVCTKCEHHVFLEEKKGWVRKLQKPCPACGEEWSMWDGLYSLIGYGRFKDWHGKVL
jgi:DNA replicative helicase MCM subunit Mcm2 (Cdc46/Mcm family)